MSSSRPATPATAAPMQQADLERLADKVYRLMLEDLRLSGHRGLTGLRPHSRKK